jgi:hypothetical protein
MTATFTRCENFIGEDVEKEIEHQSACFIAAQRSSYYSSFWFGNVSSGEYVYSIQKFVQRLLSEAPCKK